MTAVTKVFLAGPAFSPEERSGMLDIAVTLEKDGLGVYLPFRDGLERNAPAPGEAGGAGSRVKDRFNLDRALFAVEIFQLVEVCDCLVFNMNGRVPDETGSFEAAVAFGAGRPVVLYKLDHRTMLHGNDNAMVTGLTYDFSTVSEIDALPGEVRRAVSKCREYGGAPYRGDNVPPLVGMTARLGGEIWEWLRGLRTAGRSPAAGDFYRDLASMIDSSEVTSLFA